MAVKVVAADGHLYSVGPTSAGLQVWDLDCGREHLAIPVEPGERKPPRFSGFPLIDGRPHIAVITEDVIRIVDLRTGNEHLNINTDPDDPLNYLFFHVCGDTWYLVTQGTEHIHIYDLDTGTERLNLMPGHVQKLNYCAATIDARRLLIIAVNDDVVYTWSPDNDAATEYRTPARDADSIIRWIHISHEQLMIVSLFDQRVRVWNITTGAIADTFVPVVAQSMPYFVDCAEIPGQIFAVVADPSSHAVVELAPLNIRHIFSHGDGVARTALSYVTSTVVQAGDSALLLTTGWDAVVKVWDLAEDGQLQQPLGGRGAIIGMGLLEQTEHPTAFVNRFGSVSVSDLRDGSTTRTLFRSAEQSWATAANLSVCIGFRHAVMRDHDDRYRIWDYVSGIERPTVDIGNDPTGPVLVTVDGHDHLVEITSDEVMRFHDLETGAARDSTPDRIAAGETIDSWWSLGDRAYVLTTCRDGETRRWTAWNVRTGRREGMFAHPAGPGGRWSTVGGRAGITCVALDGGVVRAWRATDGQLIHTFEHGPDTPVVGLSVADQPGAFYAFTTDDSWRTHVWDLDTGVRVCSFTPSYVRKGWYALFQEVVTIDDRPHVATLNSAALIEVWDLTNGMRRRQIALDRVPSTWLMARDTDDHVRIMIATGGQYGDGVIQMWDLEESVETEPNRLFLPDPVLHMGMSDLGLVVTFGADIALFRYDDRQ
jgi:WD40 repeat protein